MESKKKEISIYSYIKVWRVEKKMYAIQNLILPVPIDPWQLLYFGGTWIVCNLLFSIIPGFSQIPVIIRSIIVPFAISKFLMTKKFDGKNPLRFMGGMIIYLLMERGRTVERFKIHDTKQPVLKLEWNCSKGLGQTGDEKYV